MADPSDNGSDGRNMVTGRFQKGWRGGPGGNQYSQSVAEFRAAIRARVTPEKLTKLVDRLISDAIGGNVHAASEVLDRVAGKPHQSLDIDVMHRRYDQMDALELIAYCEQLDERLEADGQLRQCGQTAASATGNAAEADRRGS